MDLVSESIRERTIAVQVPTAKDHLVGCQHSYPSVRRDLRRCNEGINYSDVEIVRKLALDSSVSYLKLARDGFFGDSC
jgi:hypothetical protein